MRVVPRIGNSEGRMVDIRLVAATATVGPIGGRVTGAVPRARAKTPSICAPIVLIVPVAIHAMIVITGTTGAARTAETVGRRYLGS